MDHSDGGRSLRGGWKRDPVVYVGNDPSFGQLTLDGSAPLASAPCASQADALGNPHWASLRRAALSSGNHVDDYLHVLYTGAEREVQYLAGFPQLPNSEAFSYKLFAAPVSLVDVWWYPGINEAAPVKSPGQSRPRLPLAAANVAMGLAAGTLEAAPDANAAPILLMRMTPNVWFTARVGRCNADGTANAAGAYITPIDGSRFEIAENMGYTDPAAYRFRILNLPAATGRPGVYALNPAAGWLVGWPEAGEPQWHGAQGKSGLSFGKSHVWLHGVRICGMSCSNSVAGITGAKGGNSLVVEVGVDTNTLRIQRCLFPGFGSLGPKSRTQSYDETDHSHRYFNTYRRQVIGSAILLASGAGGRVQFNDFEHINGSNVRIIATHVRDVVVGGNLIRHVNDIHGNGITLYTHKYAVIVEFNTIYDTGRPLTSMTNGLGGYRPDLYGPPSTIVRSNLFMASGDGTSAAVRFQGLDEIGIVVSENRLNGGPEGEHAITCAAELSFEQNGPWHDNILIGGAGSARAGELVAAGGGNIQLARGSPEAQSMLEEWAGAMVDPAYAPQGVGHLAGGWDGLS